MNSNNSINILSIKRIYYKNKYQLNFLKGEYILNNMDINKLLSAISKMDKEELEKNIYKAQKILENSNLKKELNSSSTYNTDTSDK